MKFRFRLAHWLLRFWMPRILWLLETKLEGDTYVVIPEHDINMNVFVGTRAGWARFKRTWEIT